MHITRRLATGLAMAALIASGSSFSQERGSKEEAIAMVDAAHAHIQKVGADKAYKDFTNDKAAWTKKDLYVMVLDGKGVMLAHGANEKLVGKDMTGIKDANGAPLVPNMLQVAATKGTGWSDYEWPHPQTKKIESKSTYVRKLPGGDGFVGVGVYR